MLLRQWVLQHWYEVVGGRVEYETFVAYETAMRLHILPALGDREVRTLRRLEIRQYVIGELKTRGHCSVRNDLSVLGIALEDAIEHELLPTNPARGAGKRLFPAAKKTRRRPLENPQLKALLGCAESIWPGFFEWMAFLVLTGLRLGEALGVAWTDIDMEDKRMLVARQWRGRGRMKDPKGGVAATIDIPDELVDILRRRREREPLTTYVFENRRRRQPFSHSYFARLMQWSVQRAGIIGRYSCHSLRHTYGTRLLACAPTEYTQSQMRHASIQVTVDSYGSYREHRNLPAINEMARRTVAKAWPAAASSLPDVRKIG